MVYDKAGKQYWNDSWIASEIPGSIDPHKLGVNNYTNRRFHEYFCQKFLGRKNQGLKLLEIGSARSAWLPYFAKEFGFKVYGIDYSEIGCQQARQVLAKAAVEGEIICANFFDPPKNMLGLFDVVVSFGVAEHFTDTTACIAKFSQFIKPEGILITIIPNLTGLIGVLQKYLNRKVYDIHVPLNIRDLSLAHLQANLSVVECRYFMSQSLGLISLNRLEKNQLETRLKVFAQLYLSRLAKVIWLLENYLGLLPETELLSPYVICLAKKDNIETHKHE